MGSPGGVEGAQGGARSRSGVRHIVCGFCITYQVFVRFRHGIPRSALAEQPLPAVFETQVFRTCHRHTDQGGRFDTIEGRASSERGAVSTTLPDRDRCHSRNEAVLGASGWLAVHRAVTALRSDGLDDRAARGAALDILGQLIAVRATPITGRWNARRIIERSRTRRARVPGRRLVQSRNRTAALHCREHCALSCEPHPCGSWACGHGRKSLRSS